MANFAIMGFGTVGSGVAEVLRMNADSIAAKLGEPLKLKYILDVRDLSATPYAGVAVKDFSVLENDPDLDVVVESIGGAKVALDFTRRALMAGKHVVTSNKELVASHGKELLSIAREKNVNYLFEASVGGGIPVLRPLFQCLAGNQIEEIVGILNGTTNYILTRMVKGGIPFDEALLDFQYSHAAAEKLPTKLTATQLKGREKDREIVQETIQPYVRREFSAPRFLSGQRPLTGAERGTATHLVMQYLPLKEDTDVRAVVEDLASRRFLTREQADAVDQTAIRRFLASPLAAELRKADHVEREFRFSLLMPGERYFPELAGGEEVMLQGVVDLYAEKDGAVTVVDFKTDYVTEDTIAEKAAHYRPQLEAYSAALEKILELPVKRRVLYFFSAGRTMEV